MNAKNSNALASENPLIGHLLKQNFFRTIIAQFGCKPCNFLWAFMSQNKPSVYVPTYLFLTDGAACYSGTVILRLRGNLFVFRPLIIPLVL